MPSPGIFMPEQPMGIAMRRSIAWLRRDLRLADNRVLATATDASERAWPVFVVDPNLRKAHAAAAGRRAWFLANVLAA